MTTNTTSKRSTSRKKTQTKKEEAVTESATPQENTLNETAETTETPQLTISDLQMIRNIIDVSSQRGAFKANEMAQVGTVYNKLDGFLNVALEAQKEAEEQ